MADGAPDCPNHKVTGVHVEPVECKSDEGGKGWGQPGTGEVPEHHLCQVLTQCMVLGVPRGRIMRLSGKRTAEYLIDVDAHPDLVAEIVSKGRAFWASLESGVAPDLDESDATARTLVDLYPSYTEGTEEVISDELARAYRDAKQAVKDAKALEAYASNRIREALGRADAQYAVTADGRRVAARSHYKRRAFEVGPAEIDQLRMADVR
jgi:predicted phage-related endonuclease